MQLSFSPGLRFYEIGKSFAAHRCRMILIHTSILTRDACTELTAICSEHLTTRCPLDEGRASRSRESVIISTAQNDGGLHFQGTR